MSILIKGMEMPMKCRTCPLLSTVGNCRLLHERNNVPVRDYNLRVRREDCPLIELPQHGDLIGRDVLADTIDGITWYHQNRNKDMVEGANSAKHQAWYKAQDIYSAITNAPTIIEAEEETE